MSEERILLTGTGANVIGLGVGVLAAVGVQILLGRSLVPGAYGAVTVAVQVAFVASAGSRFGMDMVAVRMVAIDRGRGTTGHLRSFVDRCVAVALVASGALVALLALTAPLYDSGRLVALAALSLPFIAATTVYLGATRGLGQMRQTLYVFWIGQPIAWMALAGAALAAGGESEAVVLAYDASWLFALVAARALWLREAVGFAERRATSDDVRGALRYGLPRAPAALLAQSVFWADLWVLAAFEHGTTVDAYAAAARIAQVLLLFLTSLNLVFSPFAADLHARGLHERLDELFKRSTRWAIAATLPVLIVLFVAADDVLRAFSDRFEIGATPLRILLVGQLLNVATGSVGFILIMTGFTGLDFIDNLVGVVILVGLAVALTAAFGSSGTATAAAVSVAAVNAARLLQVRRRIGIQPYERAYASLLVPGAISALVAVAAHAALEGGPWWISLGATAAGGLAAYAAVLPFVLPPWERAALHASLGRLAGRPSVRLRTPPG